MQETKCREYQLLLTNGRVVQFTQRELRNLVGSRRVRVFLGVSLIIIALANPTLFPSIPQYTSRLFYWSICVLLYLVIIPYWGLAINKLWHRLFSMPLPLLLATGPLIIALTAFASLISYVLGDLVPQRGQPLGWTDYLRNLVIAHVIETVALLVILPLQRHNPHTESDLDAPETQFVVIGGRSIPLQDILSVQSAEHYLVVKTHTKASEYRARMKDFLAQVTEEHGIQTHRSHWVAADEVVELYGNVINTRSNEDIPVSRGRHSEVRKWLIRNGKAH